MNARVADLAPLLEGIDGVLAVYAVRHPSCELAIQVDSARALVASHYRLLPARGHDEMDRVWFFWTHLPGAIAARATPLPHVARPSRSFAAVPPPSGAQPFTTLLVDVDDDVQEAVRRSFHMESRQVVRSTSSLAQATEWALSGRIDQIVAGHRAAVFQGFLQGLARKGPSIADHVIVVAPARDVPWTLWHLQKAGRRNRVLALPIDDLLLASEVLRGRPDLAAREAIELVARAPAPSHAVSLPRFRRMSVLAVDEDIQTQIFFAAEPDLGKADVTFVTREIDALEVITSRPTDLLMCGASMRSSGGEPFFRLLWRLAPQLVGRTILVASPGAIPPSARSASRPRVVERPLSADALRRAIAAHS